MEAISNVQALFISLLDVQAIIRSLQELGKNGPNVQAIIKKLAGCSGNS